MQTDKWQSQLKKKPTLNKGEKNRLAKRNCRTCGRPLGILESHMFCNACRVKKSRWQGIRS